MPVEVAAGGDEGNAGCPFLRSLNARGLSGVRLVISDAHPPGGGGAIEHSSLLSRSEPDTSPDTAEPDTLHAH